MMPHADVIMKSKASFLLGNVKFFNTPLTVQYNFCAISGTKSPKKYFSNQFECFQSHGNETYLSSRPFFLFCSKMGTRLVHKSV